MCSVFYNAQPFHCTSQRCLVLMEALNHHVTMAMLKGRTINSSWNFYLFYILKHTIVILFLLSNMAAVTWSYKVSIDPYQLSAANTAIWLVTLLDILFSSLVLTCQSSTLELLLYSDVMFKTQTAVFYRVSKHVLRVFWTASKTNHLMSLSAK